MMKVGLVLAPISGLVYQGYLKSTLESHNANYNISVWNRLFRGAEKSDNVRQKWILYIKMCRVFLIKRYTRFPKKMYSAAYSKGHFWGSNSPNFLRASLCSAQRLAFARQGKRQSNPPQPLGTQQAPNPLILPRAPGAHAFLKCYICIYVIRIWKNFYKKIFIQGAFPMGSKNINLSLQSCFLTFSISKLKSRARSNFTLMPVWSLT